MAMNRNLHAYQEILLGIARKKELPNLDVELKVLPEIAIRLVFQLLDNIDRSADALETIADRLDKISKKRDQE